MELHRESPAASQSFLNGGWVASSNWRCAAGRQKACLPGTIFSRLINSVLIRFPDLGSRFPASFKRMKEGVCGASESFQCHPMPRTAQAILPSHASYPANYVAREAHGEAVKDKENFAHLATTLSKARTAPINLMDSASLRFSHRKPSSFEM